LIPGFNTECAEITDAGLIKDAFGLGENEEIRPFQYNLQIRRLNHWNL
jgi:hypothetical protein